MMTSTLSLAWYFFRIVVASRDAALIPESADTKNIMPVRYSKKEGGRHFNITGNGFSLVMLIGLKHIVPHSQPISDK